MPHRLGPSWYAEKMRNDFAGKEEKMWREYPSTPEEAFQQSTDGNYYAKDMVLLRKRGGICEVPTLDLPVYTFWDIGSADGTAVWFMQRLGQEDRFIAYYEEHNEDLRHYAAMLQSKATCTVPTSCPTTLRPRSYRTTTSRCASSCKTLLPGHTFLIVPMISELMTGIYAVRKHLKAAWFDVDGCKQGIERLTNYKKKFSQSEKRYLDQPNKHNGCSEGADALRQWAQAKDCGLLDGMTQTSTYKEARAGDWRTN